MEARTGNEGRVRRRVCFARRVVQAEDVGLGREKGGYIRLSFHARRISATAEKHKIVDMLAEMKRTVIFRIIYRYTYTSLYVYI